MSACLDLLQTALALLSRSGAAAALRALADVRAGVGVVVEHLVLAVAAHRRRRIQVLVVAAAAVVAIHVVHHNAVVVKQRLD